MMYTNPWLPSLRMVPVRQVLSLSHHCFVLILRTLKSKYWLLLTYVNCLAKSQMFILRLQSFQISLYLTLLKPAKKLMWLYLLLVRLKIILRVARRWIWVTLSVSLLMRLMYSSPTKRILILSKTSLTSMLTVPKFNSFFFPQLILRLLRNRSVTLLKRHSRLNFRKSSST